MDGRWIEPVESRTKSDPSGLNACRDGDRFIVPSDALWEWSGLAGRIVKLDGQRVWRIEKPDPGSIVWVKDEERAWHFDGQNWTLTTFKNSPLVSRQISTLSKQFVRLFDTSCSEKTHSTPKTLVGGGIGDPSMQSVVKVKSRKAVDGGRPQSGDRFLIYGKAFMSFKGHGNEIAEWDGKSWKFEKPEPGTSVYVSDEDTVYSYSDRSRSWIKGGLLADTIPISVKDISDDDLVSSSELMRTVMVKPSDISPGDVVWDKLSRRGPWVVVKREETVFYREVPTTRLRERSFTSTCVVDTWVCQDKKGNLFSAVGPSLTKSRPLTRRQRLTRWVTSPFRWAYSACVSLAWATMLPVCIFDRNNVLTPGVINRIRGKDFFDGYLGNGHWR